MNNWLKVLLGTTPWKTEWRDELSKSLQEAQKNVRANMVVIIARESDIYTELLFVFSFLGLSIGALVAWALRNYFTRAEDLLIIPLALYSLGTSIYALRRFYISRLIPSAVKHRVNEKAKAHFFESHVVLKNHLALLYVSEIEREAILLCSPDIQELVPKDAIHHALVKMVAHYSLTNPLVAIKPGLIEIAEILKTALNAQLSEKPHSTEAAGGKGRGVIFVSASDRAPKPLAVPVLKGNKDVN